MTRITKRRGTAVAAALTTGLAATTALALPGSATAAPDDTPGYSVRSIEVDVLTGPDRDIPCTIVGDVYTPDGVDRRHKAPSVLTTNGFGGSLDNDEQRSYAQGFAMEGYVVLTYSGLGFGGSSCKITLDDPAYDGVAGKQLVDVLAGEQKFRDVASGELRKLRTVAKEKPGDPRVGMIGGSYGGQIQYAIAKKDKRIDAIIPMYTWNDLAYSLAPNNTDIGHDLTYDTAGVHKRVWTSAFFALGVAGGFTDFEADPFDIVPCPNFAEEVCNAKAQMEAVGYPNQDTLDLARHASVATYADKVKAPTLVVQGQKDTLFNLQESVATYRALSRNGVPTRIVWQSFGHSNGGLPLPGEFDKTGTNVTLTSTHLGRRFLGWMDHWVRGDSSAPLGPEFSYFRDYALEDGPGSDRKDIARSYASHKSFSQAARTKFFFTGDDALTRKQSLVEPGSASYANAPGAATSYSETSALEGEQVNNPVSDGAGTFVAFTSAKLGHRVDVVGTPRLKVHLDAPVANGVGDTNPAGQLVLFAKVYDVAKDGTPTLKNRLISPVRVGDTTKPVVIELPGIVHRFAKGHRIQVVLAASDLSYAGNDLIQPVTVSTSPDAPGVLRLPTR